MQFVTGSFHHKPLLCSPLHFISPLWCSCTCSFLPLPSRCMYHKNLWNFKPLQTYTNMTLLWSCSGVCTRQSHRYRTQVYTYTAYSSTGYVYTYGCGWWGRRCSVTHYRWVQVLPLVKVMYDLEAQNNYIYSPKNFWWMDWWMDGGYCWMNGWVDVWMGGWVDVWMGGWVDGWMGEWVDGWMGGWVDGWMGGWVDGWVARTLRWLMDARTHA